MPPIKGSIIVADGNGRVGTLTPNTNNQVLCLDDNEPLGVKWITSSGGSKDYFYAYGPSTDTDIGSGFTPITLDTEVKKDSSFTHVANSSEITINNTGEYLISFNFTGDVDGNSRTGSATRLVLDTGSGFTEVSGARGYAYHRNTTTGENTCGVSTILSLNSGDKIRIESLRISGSNITNALANGTRLTIQSL
jgi:hypothetical protein